MYEISLISYVEQFHQKVKVLPTQFLQDCIAPEQEFFLILNLKKWCVFPSLCVITNYWVSQFHSCLSKNKILISKCRIGCFFLISEKKEIILSFDNNLLLRFYAFCLFLHPLRWIPSVIVRLLDRNPSLFGHHTLA